ncbi:MAG: pitrilysin family protein, partial [Acidobacteriota bacterium]
MQYLIRPHAEPAGRIELRLAVAAGSIHENKDQLGGAHFVEHMAFNGTRNFPGNRLIQVLESFGMRFGPDLNATTDYDTTTYRLSVPTDDPEKLRVALQILEDWTQHLLFDPEEVDKERGVVLDEFRLRTSRGDAMITSGSREIFWGTRYAERIPLGTQESIQEMSRESLADFYRSWYHPDRTTVVAVGDLDPEQLEVEIIERFSNWSATSRAAKEPERFPRPSEKDRIVLGQVSADSSGTFDIRFIAENPIEPLTKARYRRILLDRFSFHLLWIVALDGLERSLLSADYPRRVEVLGFYGELPEFENALRQLEGIRRYGFPASYIEEKKRGYLRGLSGALASSSAGLADAYMMHLVMENDQPVDTAQLELARTLLADLDAEEVNRRVAGWLASEGRILKAGLPAGSSESADSLRSMAERVARGDAPRFAVATPKRKAPAEIPIPEITAEIVERTRLEDLGLETWRLSNGAEVTVKAGLDRGGTSLWA